MSHDEGAAATRELLDLDGPIGGYNFQAAWSTGWLAGSAALSFYLSNFADYNATYGSLGAAIGLMMWMWLSTIVVLLGAQLDSVIERKLPARA